MFSPTDKLACALVPTVLKSNLWEPSLCLCPCRDSDRNYAFRFHNHQKKTTFELIPLSTLQYFSRKRNTQVRRPSCAHDRSLSIRCFFIIVMTLNIFFFLCFFFTCSESVQTFTAMTHVRRTQLLFLFKVSFFKASLSRAAQGWPIQMFYYVCNKSLNLANGPWFTQQEFVLQKSERLQRRCLCREVQCKDNV